MKIRVPVTEKRYGYVEVDVPVNSPILDDDASAIAKRRSARQLAKTAIEQNSGIVWYPDEHNELEIELGYISTDDL